MGQNNYWCCYFWADSISYVGIAMSTWKINLKELTATSINGITFKLTETKSGEYEGVYLNLVDGGEWEGIMAGMTVRYDWREEN